MSNLRDVAASLAGGLLLAPLVAIASPATATAPAPVAPPHAAPATSAKPVLDWQRTALRTVYTEAATPVPVGAPYLGFTSLAMLDAVDRAARRGRASAPAAAAVAAHHVLEEYFPASEGSLDADLTASLDAIAPGRARWRGIKVGARAAAAMIAERAEDGRNDPTHVYSKPAAPGVWQPPASGMLAPWLGFTDLLVLGSRLPVDGPDDMASAAYARDFEEVRRYGSATSTDRTPAQTETARFYNANIVLQLSQALVDRLEAHPVGLRRSALLFAAVHASMSDTLIQAWRLKYDGGFWRPVEAVHGAAGDGNDATVAEPGWTPMVATPPYPEYLTGHGAVAGSTAEVVRILLGEHTPLTLRSSLTPTPRSYLRLADLEADALNARIWLGIHFRDAMEDGYSLAHRTARRVVRALR
jgi:hypothetical protein